MPSVPVTILGGSDRKAGALPESGARLHPLTAYKGAAIEIGGRPLIAVLVERLRAAEGFGPIAIAGPARIYAPLGLDVEIVDTDGSVAANLEAAIEHRRKTHEGAQAVIACDIVPTAEELTQLRALYGEAGPCALWFPFVRVPEDPAALGAFAWKPVYRLVDSEGKETVRILPGHLGIFEPRMLRLPLLYRLLGLAYRTRNRSVGYRRSVMLRAVLLSLLGQDLWLLARLRAPVMTWTVVSSGLRLARELRAGRLRISELEELVGRIFLRRHVPHAGELRIRYPVVDVVSLAEDIDTEEEAREVEGGRVG